MKKTNLIFLCFYIVSFWGCGFDCDSYLDTEIKPLLIEGTVISKSGNNCFGEIILENKNKIDTLKDVCYCTPKNQQLWKYVQVNDAVRKDIGSFKVVVTRNGERQVFDYPCCNE